MSKGKLNYK